MLALRCSISHGSTWCPAPVKGMNEAFGCRSHIDLEIRRDRGCCRGHRRCCGGRVRWCAGLLARQRRDEKVARLRLLCSTAELELLIDEKSGSTVSVGFRSGL